MNALPMIGDKLQSMPEDPASARQRFIAARRIFRRTLPGNIKSFWRSAIF
jgi:hypothetical protein